MVCLSPVGYGVQLNTISHRRQTYHINLVDQTHIQRTRPRRKTAFFKTSLRVDLSAFGLVVAFLKTISSFDIPLRLSFFVFNEMPISVVIRCHFPGSLALVLSKKTVHVGALGICVLISDFVLLVLVFGRCQQYFTCNRVLWSQISIIYILTCKHCCTYYSKRASVR